MSLDETDLLHVICQTHQEVTPSVRMLALAAPEHDRDLDLRALVQEARDVAFLGLVVVDPDLGSELDLLDVDLRLVLARELRFLLELVPVLPVVHDPGNRRVRLSRDFDQIEVLPVCVLTGVVGRLDSELLSVLADQPNVRDANRIVDARLGLGTARRFKTGTPARPQMFFTKLVLTSLETTKTAGTQRQKVSFNLLG